MCEILLNEIRLLIMPLLLLSFVQECLENGRGFVCFQNLIGYLLRLPQSLQREKNKIMN